MTVQPDSLRFQYSGFLQDVQIVINGEASGDSYKVTCSAKLKLPILKKNYITWTLFRDQRLGWIEHATVAEEGASPRMVKRESFSDKAIDPIGFFLKINRREVVDDKVTLVIGAKEITLDVVQSGNSVVVARPEKNQKLIMIMGTRGIERLEVPVPVIGNLKIERVD